ncbi:MAG: hypothetical protein KJ621_09205, partial [Proteobacteria bacterium]|nr:hypothetical protein [Pseudomonadota bacterium]
PSDLGAQILACLDDRTPTPINNLALFSRNSDPRKKRPRKNPVPQRSLNTWAVNRLLPTTSPVARISRPSQ